MPPKKKKQKFTATGKQGSISETSTVGEDALGLVMQYLAPRELYHVAFTCKALMSKVTVELVVASAVMTDSSRKKMGALAPLMRDMSIHPPTPLRLLRLINVKRCENCNRTVVRQIHPDFGVALCKRRCLDELFTREYPSSPPPYDPGLVHHRRVVHASPTRRGWALHWARGLRHGIEKCGPLATAEELIDVTRRKPLSGGSGTAATTPVSRFLQTAPPREAYQGFLHAYQQMEKQAEQRLQERQEQQRAREAERERRHKENVDRMLASIRNGLDERWRDIAMDLEPSSCSIKFRCPAVHQLLARYLWSPRECTATVTRRIVAEINDYFGALTEFCKLEFLQDNFPFDIRLRRYCQSVLMPDIQSVAFRREAKSQFFGCLLSGRFLFILSELFGTRVNMLAAAQSAYIEGVNFNVPSKEELTERLQHGIDCFPQVGRRFMDHSFDEQQQLELLRTTFAAFLRDSPNEEPIMNSTDDGNDMGGRRVCYVCGVHKHIDGFSPVQWHISRPSGTFMGKWICAEKLSLVVCEMPPLIANFILLVHYRLCWSMQGLYRKFHPKARCSFVLRDTEK